MANETCVKGCPVSLGGSEVEWLTLPCSQQEFAGFFMILVYAYIVYVASSLLCQGLEHLDNTMSAYSKRYPKNGCAKNFKQIIGGVLSPTLGAFPDAIMISVTTESQADVAAGMTLLVSSNALLLTVPWVIALFVGRKNLFQAEGVTTVVNHKPDELHSVFTKKGWTSTGLTVWSSVMDQAQIMLLSLFPFILAQFLAFVLSESKMKIACLALSVVCVGVYAFLLWFQLSDISGTGTIFETYREAINKFEDQMMWIRATGVYGAASKQDLERMFLKVQINAPQFAGVEILRDVKSQHTTVDNTVRKGSTAVPGLSSVHSSKVQDDDITISSTTTETKKEEPQKIKVTVSPKVKTLKDVKESDEDDSNVRVITDLDDIEEMRRRSDFAEALKKMNAGERRNMRMRTWALMDRTPIAQMHTILRVWVLATENKLFEDLREKYVSLSLSLRIIVTSI
jgi:Ca2+/Na+ antiporter